MTITERFEAIRAEVKAGIEAASHEAAQRAEAAVAAHLPAIMSDDLVQAVEGAAGLPPWARTFLAALVTQGCTELAKHVAADTQPTPTAPFAPDPAPVTDDPAPSSGTPIGDAAAAAVAAGPVHDDAAPVT